MKNIKPVKLTHEADEGLRKLRKDAGKLYGWAKRKYTMNKLKNMKLTEEKMKGKDLKVKK